MCEPLDEVQMTAVTKRLLLGERMRQESILKLFEWVKPILLAGGVTTRCLKCCGASVTELRVQGREGG